jgi:DNA-binding LacI/PurR family transcriptional regulator
MKQFCDVGVMHEGGETVTSSVTVKDVARVAEVSIGTVSRVFNHHHNVTEEIRQRVLKAASELGYAGPGRGATERTRTNLPPSETRSHENGRVLKEIGFIYCSSMQEHLVTANPFWSHILYGVESETRKSNIKVTYRAIGEIANTPDVLLTTLSEMRLGGILLVGPAEANTIELIKSLKLPLVLVDNYVPGLAVDAVLGDNFEGARCAVDYLINEGHTEIAFIGGSLIPGPRPINKIYTIERRAAGYRTALLDAGLHINYNLYESGDLTLEGGSHACQRLLSRFTQAPFSALFCANDATAIGSMKALREAGVHIPEDVSLIGFDDLEMVEHLTPPLTTICVNKEALGCVAVKTLITRAAAMDTVGATLLATARVILDVELIKRESVISHLS